MMETNIGIANYFQKAAGLIAVKEFPKAIKTLEEFICVAPREPLVYEFLGELYLHLHNPKKAIAPLKFAITLAPEQRHPYQLLVRAYEMLGETGEADRMRNRLVALDKTRGTIA